MTDTITHDKTPDTHSSIVGGSSASRILGCPGSVDLLSQIPDAVLKESSTYADEGTGLHEIMAYLVDNDVDPNTVMTDPKVDELWAQFKLDDARMWDAVIPAYNAFLKYLDTLYGDDENAELRIRVESRVEMPGIDGAFGTCDVLIRAPNKTVVWDWKFGQGVPVLAFYKRQDPQGNIVPSEGSPYFEYGNDQLMFYARAAMNTYAEFFGGEPWPVELVICQPRILDEELSTFDTTTNELEVFREDLVDAVAEALRGNGHKAKGSYCRFAKCKTICPLHLNGPVAMAEIGEKLGKLKAARELQASAGVEVLGAQSLDGGTSYVEALAAMLTLAEIVEPYIKEANTQAHAFMEAGGTIPNWKLVPKRAGWDGWEDEKNTDDFLSRRKLRVDERRKPWSSITPAAARKLLKAKGDEKGVKLLEKYVKPGVSSGTTIAPGDDPRPAVEATATTVRNLAEKIASLGK